MQLKPGGNIEFREMENGVVLIERWFIRMVGEPPVLDWPSRISRESALADPTVSDIARQRRVSEGGGELARASWPGEITWKGSLGTLRATIVSKGGEPVAGVRVSLSSTDYRGVTDSGGVVTIDELLPGPYTVDIADSTLAIIGVPLATSATFTAARDRRSDLRVAIPSADDYVAKLCKEDHVYDRNSLKLIARVVGPDDKPVSKASIKSDAFNGMTDDDGLFVMCAGLEPAKRLSVLAWFDGGEPTEFKLELWNKVTALKIHIAVPAKP